MEKFQVLSPDKFTIDFHNPYYSSKEKALKAFNQWKKRYKFQGYYSSTEYGKIPLEKLKDYMYIGKISNNNLNN
jgi:hypothetical protein